MLNVTDITDITGFSDEMALKLAKAWGVGNIKADHTYLTVGETKLTTRSGAKCTTADVADLYELARAGQHAEMAGLLQHRFKPV